MLASASTSVDAARLPVAGSVAAARPMCVVVALGWYRRRNHGRNDGTEIRAGAYQRPEPVGWGIAPPDVSPRRRCQVQPLRAIDRDERRAHSSSRGRLRVRVCSEAACPRSLRRAHGGSIPGPCAPSTPSRPTRTRGQVGAPVPSYVVVSETHVRRDVRVGRQVAPGARGSTLRIRRPARSPSSVATPCVIAQRRRD